MENTTATTTTTTQPDWIAIAELSADERAVALAAFGYNDCGFETHDNAVGSLVAWAMRVAQAEKGHYRMPDMARFDSFQART